MVYKHYKQIYLIAAHYNTVKPVLCDLPREQSNMVT